MFKWFFSQSVKFIHWGKESVQQMTLEKLEIHMEKNKVGSSPYLIYSNLLKVDKKLNCQNYF